MKEPKQTKKPPQPPYPGSERFGVGFEDVMPCEPGEVLNLKPGASMQTLGEKTEDETVASDDGAG